uniref:Uncharacterized protein n=1 Tax=Acrobeloides nanus TaxID=290746 RepID=A0A914CT93_9BILA
MLFIICFLTLLSKAILAQICPLKAHIVCNNGYDLHQCVCGTSKLFEEPIPVQTCNLILKIKNDEFEAVSMTIDLNSNKSEFSEELIRKELRNSLNVNDEDLVIFRIGCSPEGDKLIIQFDILNHEVLHKSSTKLIKSNAKGTVIQNSSISNDQVEPNFKPYDENDFIDPKTIRQRLIEIYNNSNIADTHVSLIKRVNKLIPLETDVDNSNLLIIAFICAVFCLVSCLAASYRTFYSQKEEEKEKKEDIVLNREINHNAPEIVIN